MTTPPTAPGSSGPDNGVLAELKKHTELLERLASAQEASNKGLIDVGKGLTEMVQQQTKAAIALAETRSTIARIKELIR